MISRSLRQLYALFLATPIASLASKTWLVVKPETREAELLLGALGVDDFDAVGAALPSFSALQLNQRLGLDSPFSVWFGSKRIGKRWNVRFVGYLAGSKTPVSKERLPPLPDETTAELPLNTEPRAEGIAVEVGRRALSREASDLNNDTREPLPNLAARDITYVPVQLPHADPEEESRARFWEILGKDEVLAAIARGDITEGEVRLSQTTKRPETSVPLVAEALEYTDESAVQTNAVAIDFAETEEQFEDLEYDPEARAEALAEQVAAIATVEPKRRLSVNVEAPPAEAWLSAAQKTVREVVDICRRYRSAEAPEKGKLCVLTPSPSAGKTEAMIEAMLQEQKWRGVWRAPTFGQNRKKIDKGQDGARKIAYAVLSREQIAETTNRIRAKDGYVGLHVIEGRHEENCFNYADVERAGAHGYDPGSTVCPSCEKYPTMSDPKGSVGRTCGYYRARLVAHLAREHVKEGQGMNGNFPIVLTTHSSLALGVNQLRGHYLGDIWEFDTIFVDEDPTSALEQSYCIDESQLSYHAKTEAGELDNHTKLTDIIREAIAAMKRERVASFKRGFVHAARTTEPDPVHTREYGSVVVGDDLVQHLARCTGALGYLIPTEKYPSGEDLDSLEIILSQIVSDKDKKSPHKGELLDMPVEEIGRKFPHRYLERIAEQLYVELRRGPKTKARNLAYKVHMDLAPMKENDFLGNGPHWGSLTLHQAMIWTEQNANIIVGDAYADVDHYRRLFAKVDESKVEVVQSRAEWPATATLVQVRTHASKSDVRTRDAFRAHLDANIYTVLHYYERDRSTLFYVNKSHRAWLDEWLHEHAARLQLPRWAIEHWGSGRGKDIYRGYDTFIGVTEFLPNIAGLVHEANAKAFDMTATRGAAPERIRFWSGPAHRVGGEKYAHAMDERADLLLVGEHNRRTVDELAQAVHRIRPAIPTEDGRGKHMWVFGFRVALSKELIAATDFWAPEGGLQEMVEQNLRGRRAVTEQLFTASSSVEMAMRIGSAIETAGCWGPPFGHSLINANCAMLGAQETGGRWPLLLREISESERPRGAGATRLYEPPSNWDTVSGAVTKSHLYHAAVKRVLADLPSGYQTPVKVLRPWMPSGSHGWDCIGGPGATERFAEILDSFYSPEATRSAISTNQIPF